MKYTICAGIAMLFSVSSAYAVVAKPGLIEARQSDGSTITIRMEGGPRNHIIYNQDDQLLRTDERGFYVLADESFKDKCEQKRNVSKAGLGLMTNPFPSTGKQNALVILVEFSDCHFTIENPKEYYEEMLNGESFTKNGATGSARQYFLENSGNMFDISFDIYGPVRLEKSADYYGENDYWGDDKRPHEMIIDACDILDTQYDVDFTEYDKNNDGSIDNVYVFYAGYGEADGGGPNTIWPHSWEIFKEAYVTKYLDGKLLNHYACSNELQYSSPDHSYIDGIGTFCHEFSHVMGLPDLYSTIGGGAFTPDSWTLMDSGSYNNMSRTPPYYSAFERYAFDWITPIEITEPGVYTLEPIGESNQAYIIHAESDNEYFLLENRQLQEWDAHIPSHGMLVWHIDYDIYAWNSNRVNIDAKHQRVDLVEADGIPSNWTRDGDVFPGLYEKDEFSSESYPALVSWNGKSLGIDLKDIKETPDGCISFYASLPGTSTDVENIYQQDVTSRYYNLQGVEIMNPAKGEIIIERRGDSVRKIIF